jgi:glycerate kinase
VSGASGDPRGGRGPARDPRGHVLEDVLPRGARVLFCGTAAGTVSARVGAPYAGPGNAFWPTLHEVGILPARLAPADFRDAAGHGVALTDLDKRGSGSDAEIGRDGFDPAAVAAKVAACGARVVAFTSKTSGSTALGRPVAYGRQPEPFGGAEAWVLPSPSGRARRFWDLAPWAALAARLRERAPVVLCAPDKLRGAVDAAGAAEALAAGVRDAGGWPVLLPVADGGEGTLDAVLAAGRGRPVAVRARDAHGREVDARIAVLHGAPDDARGDGGRETPAEARVAGPGDGADPPTSGRDGGAAGRPVVLVEAAEAIALAAVPEDERHVGRASSAGVGDLLRAALELGAGRILVAVGGSASIDGGAGMLRALGAGAPADGDGLLADPAAVDPTLPGLDPRLAGVLLELLHDVDAPLCGPGGAARRFGPQKGASPAQVDALDAALARWAAALGTDPDRPGSGAAGGLGLALMALGAAPRPGAEAVLELVGFDAAAAGADLVLTAEGAVDASTLQGKAVDAVVRRAAAAGVPCTVLSGRVDEDAGAGLRARGAAEVVALGAPGRPLEQALRAAPDELRAVAGRATAALVRD